VVRGCNRWMIIGLVSSVFLSVAHAQIDERDAQRESRFHDIYLRFNQEPTAEEAWSGILSGKKSEAYAIVEGDNLWNISQTLFADPNFWPKIWSLNSDGIENPHSILPGDTVRFFPGDLSEPPSLAIESGQPSRTDLTEAPKLAQLGVLSDKAVKIPPPIKNYRPAAKNLPPSLPAWTMVRPRTKEREEILKVERKIVPPEPAFLTHFIENQSIADIGEVKEVELGYGSAADYMSIVVKLEDPNQRELVAVKEVEKVRDPNAILRSGAIIEVQGLIEVLEPVNAGSNYFRAIVKKAILPITVGAKLIPGPLPMVDESGGDPTPGIQTFVIGGSYERNRELFGSYQTIFLDAGSAKGVQVGQILPVYANTKRRNGGSVIKTNERQVGSIKVVRVAEGFSTAIVLSAYEDVQVGDKTFSETPDGLPHAISNENEDNDPFMSDESANDSSTSGADEFAPEPASTNGTPAEGGTDDNFGAEGDSMDAPEEAPPADDGSGDF
jgi:hypothetical protein